MTHKRVMRLAKGIRLSQVESDGIRETILRHAAQHPLPNADSASPLRWGRLDPPPTVWEAMHSMLFPLRPASAISFATTLLVVFGSGFSVVAAQNALPGDFLYPMKVHVIENVEAMFNTSTDAQVQFQTDRFEARLQEASQLAAAGRLNGDLQKDVAERIHVSVARLQTIADDLAKSGNAVAALDLHSQVETDLMANAAVLSLFQNTTPVAKEDLQNLVTNVSNDEREVMKVRAKREEQVFEGAKVDMKASAEAGLSAALKKIDDVRAYIDANGDRADPQVLLQVNARFEQSKRVLSNARVQLESKRYDDAFRTARDAQRTAQEAKAMLNVSATLRQQLQSSSSVTAASSSTAVQSSSTTAEGTQISAATHVNTKSAGGVDADGTLHVKVGL